VTNSDDYFSCKCNVCEQLNAIAHDECAFNDLYLQIAHKCPAYQALYVDKPEQLKLEGMGT